MLLFFYFCLLFLSTTFTRFSDGAPFKQKEVDIQKEWGIELGKSVGITQETSSITPETLQRIVEGVAKGNAENIYFYGLLKLYGISLSKDPDVAAENFLRAALLGHKESTTAYGVLLLSGSPGVPKDEIAAIAWFRKGVSLNDMNAVWLLGKALLERANGEAAKYKEAATLFLKAADEGDVPQAEYSLAMMFEYGLGVSTSYEKAAFYYGRAVEKNDRESMYNLAVMYAHGRGPDEGGTVLQDFTKAVPLLEAAANSQHAPSIYYIGIFKANGYGYERNFVQAVNWFEKAAGLDDFRVSKKARESADNLRAALLESEDLSRRTMAMYDQRNYQSGLD
jgi:TPR repeat protein